MPILNDIMDHEVIGPAIRQGLQQGLQQGLLEGLQQGRREARQEVTTKLLEKRFGPLPSWMESKLAILSASELDLLALRIFDASNLEELLPPPAAQTPNS